MDAEIGILPRRLAATAVGVLALAFDQDPILTHYLGQGRRRAVAYRMFFADVVQSTLPFGHVYVATAHNRLLDVAAWKPRDPPATSLRTRTTSALRERVVRALYPRAAQHLFAGFANLEPLHPSEPHWYLMFVGIEPGLQSQGLGSQLLAPALQLADEARKLCYLETPLRRTHVFYQRLGFDIASESYPFAGAPPLWTMIRKPRTSSG